MFFSSPPNSPSSTSSLLYTILPTVVQTHLPRYSPIFLCRQRRTSHLDTPPTQPSRNWLPPFRSSLEDKGSVSSSYSDLEPSSPPPSQTMLYTPPDETAGLDWRYASQGLTLLSSAIAEAQAAERSPRSAPLSRQLYIHALTYLLQGLPQVLFPSEKSSLTTAIPASLVLASQPNESPQALLAISHLSHVPTPPQTQQTSSSSSSSSSSSTPSLLHRLLASTITHLFLLLRLLLPYITIFLRSAYRYERTHHVSERLLVTGIDVVNALGRRGVDVMGLVLKSGDGRRLGEFLVGRLRWWVDGICGGVQEGVGIGLGRIEYGVLEL